MVIKHKIWIAIGLGVILTTLYYYIYAFFQIWFDKLCENYYCIEFFPIGDFIACYIAIVGLYFVVTSLDAWKNQYKFEEAVQTIKMFDQQLPMMQLLISHIHVLINDSKKNDYGDMFGAEQNFEDMLKNKNIYHRLDKLGDTIRNNKNNLHQEKFESLYEEFDGAINEIIQTIRLAGLSEPNYSDDQQYNKNVKKAKLKKVEDGLKKLKNRNELFVSKYNNLKSRLEL